MMYSNMRKMHFLTACTKKFLNSIKIVLEYFRFCVFVCLCIFLFACFLRIFFSFVLSYLLRSFLQVYIKKLKTVVLGVTKILLLPVMFGYTLF